MEVEVVMTPYEEVYMAGRWRLRLLWHHMRRCIRKFKRQN